MNSVFLLDIVALAAILVAVPALWRIRSRVLPGDAWRLLAALVVLVLFRNLSNVLEWSGVTGALDSLEDYSELLAPVACFFLVHTALRERDEQSLRRNEGLFRMLAENSRDMIFRMSLPGCVYEYVSPASTEVIGYTPEQIKAEPQHIRRAIHPDWRVWLEERWELILADKMPPVSEYQIVHGRTGETRDIFQRNTMIRDEAGRPVAVEGFVTDVTERNRAAEALRRGEEKYRTFFENSVDAMLIIEGDSFVDCNEATVAMLRHDAKEDLINTHPSELSPEFQPDGRKSFEKAAEMMRIAYESGAHRFEWDHQRKDGEVFPVEVSLTAVPRGEGMELHTVWREITERRRAERALRESERLLRQAEAIAHAGSYSRDIESGAVTWSDELYRIFGYAPGSVSPTFDFVYEHIHPDDRESFKRANDVLANRNTPYDLEHRIIRRDGEIRSVRSRSDVERDASGKPIRQFGSLQDITDRKRAEEERLSLERQVQHAQKLESLGVLAGGIAHDFNNILMAILGNADLALGDLSPHAPARNSVKAIEEAALRAASLAKQMLAYSGKGKFVIERIDLNEFIDEMVHMLEVSISKKAVLKLNFADNLPAFEGDVTQIRQVIMNLITNASEAIGDESGVIALSTGVMECDRGYFDTGNVATRAGVDEPPAEGVYVYFEASDTGCGMDSETQHKIFDPFFTTKFTGRGLGMAAVLGIVRGHKGAIKIYSEVGKGTTFKILFPALLDTERPGARRQETETMAKRPMGGVVLLADDEESVRVVGKQMLERIGFRVLTAVDGRSAVEVFRKHVDKIACVLLDLTMPHLNGEEVFREIRVLRPDVRVILSSGYNEQDATQRFAGKGLAGFLQKPYQLEALVAAMKAAQVLEADY